MIVLRYVLPGAMIVLGIVSLPVDPDGMGVDLFAMLVGGGLAVMLMNVLFRWGASGDRERQAEAEARDFYARHGHWPDEPPPSGRRSG